VDVVGGNVDDAVVMSHLHTDNAGLLRDNLEPWFVILKVLYRR
jgi:hypothetical protein